MVLMRPPLRRAKGGAAVLGDDVAARAERLELARRGGPLARLADDSGGRADVGFAAGLLPALAARAAPARTR